MSGGGLIVSDHGRLSECDLWRSVVTLALDDLGSSQPALVLDVVEWMAGPDFEDVCEWAGICPVKLLAHMQKAAREKNHARRRYMCRAIKRVIAQEMDCGDEAVMRRRHMG